MRIDLQKRIKVKVLVTFSGDATGVKDQGGQFEVSNREVTIESLPEEIPGVFNVDIRELKADESVRAGDLPMTGSMTLLTPAHLVLCHVIGVKVVEVAAPVADTKKKKK